MNKRGMVIVTFCLCGFIYGQEARSLADIARESKAKAAPVKPCALSMKKPAPATVTDLIEEPDACTYMNGVSKLLAERKFSELEQVAAVARSSKARFVGGGWKLYTFYLGVGPIPDEGSSQANWDSRFENLKSWLSRQPTSVTPYVALADFYLSDGWKARGNETADKVTENGWEVFDERAKQAKAILIQARGLKIKCPEWYRVMMTVAVAQGWTREEEAALFNEAIAFEPEYYYYYQRVGWYLMPKWYGEEGEFKQFAQAMADRIGGRDGDILYWLIAAGTVAGSGSGTDGTDLSWIRIRRGYHALVEKYGETLLRQNEMCYMAVKFGDALLAADLFGRIGENWTPTWHKREYFDNARNWATTHAAPLQQLKDVYSESAANLETPEGAAYSEVIAHEFLFGYGASLKECALVESPQGGRIQIALKVGQSGDVEQLLVSPQTTIGNCLSPKVQKAVFTRPPKPDYWVSFYLTPQR